MLSEKILFGSPHTETATSIAQNRNTSDPLQSAQTAYQRIFRMTGI